MSFTVRLALTLLAAIAAVVLLAPLLGMLVAGAGFHIPFPRIFDRVVMATVFVALRWNSRDLRFVPLLSSGFADPARNLSRALRRFAAALLVIAILGGLALTMGGSASASLAAAAIAISEIPAVCHRDCRAAEPGGNGHPRSIRSPVFFHP